MRSRAERLRLPGRHPDDRELASLAVPAFFTFLAAPLYELTDTAIVGRLGVPQLAGLGIAAIVYTTTFFVFNSVTTGLAGSIARRRGAGDDRAALQMWVAGAWVATTIAVVCALVLAFFAEPLMRVLGASAAVQPYAVTYLRISVLGLPPLMLAASCTNYLRAGRGDARSPLVVVLVANVINLLLEMLFVWGFGWGVAGSAWSTALVQWMAVGVFLVLVLRPARGFAVRWMPSSIETREVTQVGGWMVMRTVFLTAALMGSTMTAARISDEALAAHQIVYQVWLFLAFAVSGLEVAVNALVGKHIGGADAPAARRVARRALEFGVSIGVASGVVVLLLRSPIASLFTNNRGVAAAAAGALVIVALMQPIGGVAFTLDGLLVGSGDVRFLAVMMATAFGFVFLPGALLVVHNSWGLDALWWVMAAWVAYRALVGSVRYATGRWVGAAPIPAPTVP